MISLHRDTANLGNKRKYNADFEPVDFGGDLAAIARAICRYAWSPSQWLDGGRRLQECWARALYCVLDFDDGMMTVAQAKRAFADCRHIIGTTRNHQRVKDRLPACDRLRVVVPFARVVENLAEFRASQAHWIGRYGSDDSCIDGARFYWPCKDIISIQTEGDAFEVIPPPPPPKRRDYTLTRQVRMIPRYLQPILMNGAPEGERNATCFRLGAELARCGFADERIYKIVEASPITLPIDELRRAVANGIKAARAEGAPQ